MINIYSQYQNIIASITGILTQIIFTKNIKVTLVLAIIVSSIMVNLYLVYPLVEYIKVENTRWEATIYAIGATLSLVILRVFVNLFPAIIKIKLIKALGLDIDTVNSEIERISDESNTKE